MRIIIAYNYDPSNLRAGGGITYVHNLITNFIDSGIKVTLFGVQLSEKNTFKHENFEFIPVLKGTDNWWKFLFKLKKSIKKAQISESDLIHTHHPLVMYAFIHHFPNNSKICTFHGVPLDWVKVNYPHIYNPISLIYKPVEKKVINNTDIITTAGSYPKIGLEERYPSLHLENKIKVIPSGVNLEKFKIMENNELKKKYNLEEFENIVIFVGRLSEQKNLEFLLRSFLLFEKSPSKNALLIVGTGEKEEELKKLSKRLNVKNALFFGEAETSKVVELLNCSDVFALTSWYEASPTVVKEALSCGLPVVTTDVGDVKSIIQNKYLGIVNDELDENSFVESLNKMINLKKGNSKQVKQLCREKALKDFSFDSVASEFIKLFKSL